MRNINLRPIGEVVDNILAKGLRDAEAAYSRHIGWAAERVKKVESTRQALALLDGAGIDLDLPEWRSGESYTLHLGFFPNSKAGNRALGERLREVHRALGCGLLKGSKGPSDGDKPRIKFSRRAKYYPGIEVTYERRLDRKAKCRIVKTHSTYKTLVCDVG